MTILHVVSSAEDSSIKSLSPCECEPPTTNWVKMFMLFCVAHTQKFLAAQPEEKSSLFPEVSELWRQFADISKVCKPTTMKAAIDQFVATDSTWRVLYKFLSLLFKAGVYLPSCYYFLCI